MSYKLNIFSKKLNRCLTKAEINDLIDDDYVNITGDTMTGNLTVPTLYATDSGSSQFTTIIATDSGYSEFNGGIVLQSGRKLIFDGA